MNTRLKDNYYSDLIDLTVLTDEEFNELVILEEIITRMDNMFPWDISKDLINYISPFMLKNNHRCWELIGIAYNRLDDIVKLCLTGK